jgi:cytochrome c biogenesis protein CcdA
VFPLTIATGLLLGIRHALDADHLVAVSTLAAEERRLWPAARLGLFWGLGHMLTLGLIGIPVLMLRLDLPTTLEASVNLVVGCLLVVLGARSILHLRRERIHFHAHANDDDVHAHFHIHRHEAGHQHLHITTRIRRPFLTFVIGCVHGVAGSGAAVILALTAAPSMGAGILYLLVFGLGTTLGMFSTTLVVAAPAVLTTQRFSAVHRGLRATAGAASVVLGVWMWVAMLT